MKILHFNDIKDNLSYSSVTIGQFDGLHLAHKLLLKRCLKEAKKNQLNSIFITFNPSIDSIINKDSSYLLSLTDTQKEIEKLGFDYFIIIDFDQETVNTLPNDFISQLDQKISIQKLIVGFDFTFGKEAKGNINLLLEHYQKKLIVINKKTKGFKKIGTKYIKQFLKNGQIKKANKMLGYDFYLTVDKIYDKVFTSPNIRLLKEQEYLVEINNKRSRIYINEGHLYTDINDINDINAIKDINDIDKIIFLK